MKNSQPSPPGRVDPREAAAELLRRRADRGSLLGFTSRTFAKFAPSWHHRLLCDRLDAFARGDVKRLMVMMPPRHGKSELVSRRLPAYLLGRDPDAQLMLCSYSSGLASRMNRAVQRIMDSPRYAALFPGTRLRPFAGRDATGSATKRTGDLFEIVGREGSFQSAGVDGGISGMGFTHGIIDDPIKNAEQARSHRTRENVWSWYTSTFLTRQAPSAGILVTSTRWDDDDLCGRLLKLAEDDPEADQWETIRLPAIAEETRAHPLDPRKEGEALWPERFDLDKLAKFRAASESDWLAMFQQDPRMAGGREWGDEFWGDWVRVGALPMDRFGIRIIAVDPSIGKNANAGDYSAIIGLGIVNGLLWIEADIQRRRPKAIVSDLLQMADRWNPHAIGIEAVAFQELLIDEVRRQMTKPLPVFAVEANGPKPLRIRRLGPFITRREVRVLDTPGGRLLLKQLREWPSAPHDDGPDALEMAIRLATELPR